jgi:alcohol oxidase
MMYTRAAASDYDDWETVYGNVGWGSKDLIPLLKKVHFPPRFSNEVSYTLFAD